MSELILKTPEACLVIVKEDGQNLQHVPEWLKIPALCLEAVQRNGLALGYVPEKLKTPEVCLAAIQDGWTNWQWREWNCAVRYLPETLKTLEFYLTTIPQNGLASICEGGGHASWTPELCVVAVQKHTLALGFMPTSLKTPELCLAAIQTDCSAVDFVPHSFFKNQKFCMSVAQLIDINSNDDEEILATCMTPELWFAIIQKGLWNFHRENSFIPLAVIGVPECCLAVIQQDGMALRCIPEKLKTLELCLAAVTQNPDAIRHMPYRFITEKFLHTAIKQIPVGAHEGTEYRLRQAFDSATIAAENMGLDNIDDPYYAMSGYPWGE